ncbi:hypothetical protein HDV01_002722 [Terramyces sp. JEL0728]|nr:hypothetical protein HDV01_002722 [Terramyces sp. JEL0728]
MTDFLDSYLIIMAYLVLYILYKIVYRTKLVPLTEVDLITGAQFKKDVIEYEEGPKTIWVEPEFTLTSVKESLKILKETKGLKLKGQHYDYLLSIWDTNLLPKCSIGREKQLVMKWATTENLIDPALIYEFAKRCDFTNIEFTRIFMKACFIGSDCLFDYTLPNSLDVNNAMRFASAGGHFGIIKKLLDSGRLDLQLMKTSSFPILVSRGYFDIVLFICNRVEGCVDARNLRLAVNGGHYEMTKYFIQLTDPSLDNNYCIRSAIRNSHTKLVALLLNDNRVTPSSDGLKFAISKGFVEITKLLLDDGRCAVDGCLKLAVDAGNIDLVHMLLETAYYKQNSVIIEEMEVAAPAICPFADGIQPKSSPNPFSKEKSKVTKHYPSSPPSCASDLNACQKEKNSALLSAIKKNHNGIFHLLISDPSINAGSSNNASIRAAINTQNIQMVSRLLEDEQVDPSSYSNYCVYLAIKLKNIEILTLLLDHPAVNPLFMENDAISLAVRCENLEILKKLLMDGRADPAALNHTPLKLAVMRQLPDCVELLLNDFRVDPRADSSFALREAVRLQNRQVVEILLNDGRASPCEYGNYCIMEACKTGNLEVAKLLVNDKRVDPVCNDNAPIRFAVESGNLELVKYFLQLSNVDPSAGNQDAIHSSIILGNYEIFELLLKDSRVDPSTREDEGLINAVARNSFQIIQTLLQDPRISIQLDDYYSFRLAIQLQNTEIVKLFLNCDDLDPNADGSFPLRYACYVGNMEILELLLQDQRIKIPKSAAASATAGGNFEIFDLLVSDCRFKINS